MEEKKYRDERKIDSSRKTIDCPCPDSTKFANKKCREIDVDYVVNKLHELISDPVTQNDVSRISRLLYDYQEYLSDRAYMVKHLTKVIKVFEFLATNAKSIEDYRSHLDRMLDFSNRPPLLENTYQSLLCLDIMEQYFTLFGYLLTILPNERELLKVREALRSLLIRTVPADSSVVKPELCRAAMERSNLSFRVTEIFKYTSSPEAYSNILELVFLLSSVSCVSCQKMLEAGILNPLLIRMDLSYSTQVFCKLPPDNPFEGDEYSDDTMSLIMNILWTLTRSILAPKEAPVGLKDLPTPTQCAMWGLRYAFKKQLYKSQNCKLNAKLRNEMALLILLILQIFPRYIIISSGIANDVLSFFNGCLSGQIRVWSKDIKFLASKENLVFFKILLSIVSDLTEINASIPIMIEQNVLPLILRFIDLNSKSIWSPSQFWHLFEHAIFTLTVLAPKMADEFVNNDGTQKLISILKWCANSNEFDSKNTMNCTKAICSIVLSKNPVMLKDFREQEVILTLLDLIDRILHTNTLTMEHQRIMTIILIGADELIREESYLRLLYGNQNIRIIRKLLDRCVYYRKNDDFHVDQRLLLAIGSYIWSSIVPCPLHAKNFVDKGTIYAIIDVIEVTPAPVRCLFLGLLSDICENIFCGHFLCTWRGMDKNKGFMSLLTKIWREEEKEIGVKRRPDGTVEDPELPQMGVKQWLDTYHSKLTYNVSPALIDMIGSVRSKIYAICQIIERYGEKYEMARNHYKILFDALPIEDQITMSTINLYFRLKIGETWVEISKYLAELGVTPLGMDGQIISLMTQRYHSWGLFIQERQRKINASFKNIEEIEEKEEYARIRDSMLAPTFDALDEIEYIRRTTDRTYMLKKKDLQNQMVNEYLRYPPNANIEQCHRTFQENINVTAVFDQHRHFTGRLTADRNSDLTLVTPVSSTSSSVCIDSSIYDVSFSEDLSCERDHSYVNSNEV
ncbi:cilia- and flagella-associated protein 69-like [Polistes fuscatus]|uniref:cilia- and flagella-associated protein 69-like n=1 Tax=Polistes fuscatus TaxID=30207 RepID=UPI001CA8D5C3|nr:cilia- and flagella-associated protein 69-like [Polistes fuscatus]